MSAASSVEATLAYAERVLRQHGTLFAYLHGSHVQGNARVDSDIDVAAYLGRRDVHSWELLLPESVDLLVLDTAPLEFAGRVALNGRLLFEADADVRIRWEGTTRKRFFEERPRVEQAHKEFLEYLRRK